MKKLLFPLPILLVLSLATRGQTIQSTPATPHTLGAPTHTPSTYGSNIAYDKTNKIFYRWTGSAWTAGLPGSVTDGDKGDVTVSSSGTNWQLDATSVGNTEIASGAGGIYKGSGTVPASTVATATNGFSMNSGASGQILLGDYGSAGLGGNLNLQGSGAILGTPGYQFRAQADDAYTQMVSPGYTVRLEPTTAYTLIQSTATNGYKFWDNRASPKGVEYSGDYSAGYSTRSLVDKAYVDAANATNANLTGPVTSVGNATTITANAIDSVKVAASGLSPSDIGPSGASVGQVMMYTANGWRPATPSSLSDGDKGDITVSGSGATWNIDADAVGSGEIAADAVGASEIATDAVGAAEIAADAVGSSEIATDAVDAAEIAANAVGASELAATAVVAGSYTYSAITVDADGRLTSASNGTAPVVNGGNSFGTTMTIGTNDAQSLNLEVGGVIVAQQDGTRWASYGVSTAGTSAMGTTFFHNTEVSGTPAAGFGGALEFGGESSTANYTSAAKVGWQWTNATHASRTSELVFHTVNSGTMAERMSLSGSGTLETTRVTIQAGTATAGTAPLKFTSGTNLTTPESGAVEFDGTNYYATASTTRYTLAKTLTATAALNFPNTASGATSDLTITVTGAADGDAVSFGTPNAAVAAGSDYSAWVSAANTVTIRFSNFSGAAIDPASATFRASVLKY